MTTPVGTPALQAHKQTLLVYVGSSGDDMPKLVTLDRDPLTAARKAPAKAQAFYYYDEIVVMVSHDGRLIPATTTRLDTSRTYYIDARVITPELLEHSGDTDGATYLRSVNMTYLENRFGFKSYYDANRHVLVSSC